MSAVYSPAVAFGLFAATLALKAKQGPLRCDACRDLLQRHRDLVPDDWPAAIAAADFVANLSDDPIAAADQFLEFLSGWPNSRPTPTGQIETTLAAVEAEFEASGWGARRDCGHG